MAERYEMSIRSIRWRLHKLACALRWWWNDIPIVYPDEYAAVATERDQLRKQLAQGKGTEQ